MTETEFSTQYERLIVATKEPHPDHPDRNLANYREWWGTAQNLNAYYFREAVDMIRQASVFRTFPTWGDFIRYYNGARRNHETDSAPGNGNVTASERQLEAIDTEIRHLPSDERRRRYSDAAKGVRHEVEEAVKVHKKDRQALERHGFFHLFDCLVTSREWVEARVKYEVRKKFAAENNLPFGERRFKEDEIPF